MFESIKQVAKENGCDYIVFNSHVANVTPSNFNIFVSKIAAKEKIYLKKIGGIKAIEEWNDKHYLEAFGGWKFPRGTVEGYIVRVE